MQNRLKEKVKKELNLLEEAEKDVQALQILETALPGYIEGAGETMLLTQDEIKRNVSQLTMEKAFSLYLEKGPFFAGYTKNGRHMFVHNKHGFLSAFDVKLLKPHFEIDVKDDIRDATFLHNECFVAAAQRECVYIYNNEGSEVHCVRDNRNVYKLEYMFYHFLLCSLSFNNFLKYQDASTGKMVAEIFVRERHGVMKQNRSTAILYLGSEKGTVSLWSPNSKEYMAKMACHSSSITNVEIDRSGTYLLTAGSDKMLKIWDIRNNHMPLNAIKPIYNSKCTALSDNNYLALGSRKEVLIYKDIFSHPSLYLRQNFDTPISDLSFCPYEDILTVGHGKGITNMIVPGCGDPVFDTTEDNPFETKRERREKEVKRLLEKIPFGLIGIKEFEFEDKTANNKTKDNASAPSRRSALDRFYRK
jgi:U3 small nucleolar RNA-associated protein 7